MSSALRLAAVLGAAVSLLVALGAAAPSSARAAWSPTSTGCPSGVGSPCYVWKSPEGVITEGGKYMSKVEFETLGADSANAVIEGGHLSPAAKTVIEDGHTVPEAVADARGYGSALATPGETTAASGAEAASDAAGLFEASGVLPALGAVVSFGVGAAVGSEICHAIGISGCWFFGSGEGDPPPPSEGHWIELTSKVETEFGVVPAYNWGWGVTNVVATNVQPLSEPCGVSARSGTDYQLKANAVENMCVISGVHYTRYSSYQIRWMMSNRVLNYESSDNPSISNYSYTAPGNWSERAAKAMTEPGSVGLGRSGAALATQFIASKVPGSNVPNPYSLTVPVPDCDGLLYAKCAELIEKAGLKPTHKELGWQQAVTADPPEQVEELQPARSTEVEKGSTVTVVTNPDGPDMPVVVPSPGANETYDQYVATLNPALAPSKVVLSATNEDPSFGPDAVTGTNPVAGTRVDPSLTTPVTVDVNPPDAPPASGPPGGGFVAPSVPAIAAPGLAVHPCGVFPFGLFCWVKEAIAEIDTAPKCPSAQVPLGVQQDTMELGICKLPEVEHWMGLWRTLVVFFFTIGCAWTFAKATGAVGAGGDDD